MDPTPRQLAHNAREASLKMRVLPTSSRVAVLEKLALELENRQSEIMAKNANDVEKARGLNIPLVGMSISKTGQIADALMKRLQLKEGKLSSAVDGIRRIARSDEPIGKCLSTTLIMKGLVLEKITVPIGVTLVIFEVDNDNDTQMIDCDRTEGISRCGDGKARPEALLQIAALAIRSGNGLLLKGGKEASESNFFLHSLISSVLNAVLPKVGSGLIGLVQRREDIADLLKLDDVIDLVIPRGSNQLVSYIQQNTKIAVLGHADGICHVYIDEAADLSMAVQICLDSKTDYAAACNAVETILMHVSFMTNDGFEVISTALRSKGVKLFKGQHASLKEIPFDPAPSLSYEYSAMEVTIEVVDDIQSAINHINTHGSSHTDTIVTSDVHHAETFLASVDSSCVFHNASTRWSDGYRFGLGAEVGISTSRIHARGPVGVEGLMTTKFVLHGGGHLVHGDAKKDAYVFQSLKNSSSWKSGTVYAAAGFLAALVLSTLLRYARGSSVSSV